jgi:hypothetical protein
MFKNRGLNMNADTTINDLSRSLEYITRVSWILRRVINELDDEGATRDIIEAALTKVDLAGQSVEDEIATLKKWGL